MQGSKSLKKMKLAVEMVGCEDGRAVAREMRDSRSQAAGGAEREEKKINPTWLSLEQSRECRVSLMN